MEQPTKTDKYTLYDWMLIVIAFLLIACLCLGFKACSEPQATLADAKSFKEEMNAVIAQNRYDNLSAAANKQIDSLKLIIAGNKKKTTQIVHHYVMLHDTITITPEAEQQRITKMLCPATGDSVNLKEINYCLADGKQAQDLFRNSVSEIRALELEVKLNEELVTEGLKNMEAKDNLNSTYREVNGALNENLQKQTRRKKVWRNVSVGSIVTLIAVILISF